jgi:PAS domain S-box-containing protein
MFTFIVGESELAKRIRTYPWHETALGSVETWPQSLKTLVNVMLAANQQMYVVWGPAQILLYNDRYIEVLQGHHPAALGRPFIEVWNEIADDLRPLVENAYAGIPTYMDDITLFLERKGFTEETHFTYSYTPVFNANGGIDGFFCACIETTEQVNAEKALRESEERRAFLLKLSDALRPLIDADEIQRVAARLAAEHWGMAGANYVRIETRSGVPYAIVRQSYVAEGREPINGDYPLADFPGFTGRMLAGETMIVPEVASDPKLTELDKANWKAMDIANVMSVSLVKEGRLVACFAVHGPLPKNWTIEDAQLLEEIAERTWAAVERTGVEAALRDSEERFQQFADASSGGLWIRDAHSLALEYASRAMATIYGVDPDESLGELKQWAAKIVPEDRERMLAHIDRAKAGEPVVHEFRIQRPSDGAFRWVRNTDFPLLDNGLVQRIGGIAEDVTEARLLTEHQGVLVAELQHRVRNIMAMVRSMTNRSAQGAESVDDYRSLLEGRLLALARVQTLLTREKNTGGSLRSIIESEITAQAHHGGQFELTGPDVTLSPKAVEVLTLAFHELATNALKYGALSTPDGRLSVRWRAFEKQGVPWIALDWIEERALPGEPIKRRGFGSELIEGRIPYELRGSGRLVITSEGARCHLEFPLMSGESILETDAPKPAKIFGGILDMTGAADLTGKTVLLVEDDYYQAADTAAALRGAGAKVVGPCPDAETAREILEAETPTHAVLDLNLGGGGPRFEIAQLLMAQGVPFVLVTGYDPDVLPEKLKNVARLQKPVELRAVVEAVSQL